jgi:hypothetical protein
LKKKDQFDVDYMLARGHIGGPGHDRILEEVLRRTSAAPARPSPIKRLWPALVASTAVSLALAVWMSRFRLTPDPVRPKGAAHTRAAVVDIRCGLEGLRVCRRGDTLMFEVAGISTTRYLNAYAEREGDPAHARVWYFPTSAGMTPVVAAGAQGSIVRKGIKIGDEHPAGKYRATIVLSSRPLARAELAEVPPDVRLERMVLEFQVSDQGRVSP